MTFRASFKVCCCFCSKQRVKLLIHTLVIMAMIHKAQAGRRVLLGILGEHIDVPAGPLNPDPISDQKNVIFHTHFQTRPTNSILVSRPGFFGRNYVMSN